MTQKVSVEEVSRVLFRRRAAEEGALFGHIYVMHRILDSPELYHLGGVFSIPHKPPVKQPFLKDISIDPGGPG
jgi:hypothetical protein